MVTDGFEDRIFEVKAKAKAKTIVTSPRAVLEFEASHPEHYPMDYGPSSRNFFRITISKNLRVI